MAANSPPCVTVREGVQTSPAGASVCPEPLTTTWTAPVVLLPLASVATQTMFVMPSGSYVS